MKNSSHIPIFKFLISFFLLTYVIPSFSQTPVLPGWHSMIPLNMSQNTCFNKAVKALNAADLDDIRTQDNWTTSGINNYLRASISCVSCGDKTLVDVAVAGANGRINEAVRMRDFLKDYMLGNPSNNELPCTITGTYQTTYKKMRLYQEGNRVYGTYEHKDGRVEGRLTGNVFKGMWYQSDGQGELELTFSNDCRRFTSNYYDKGKWYSDWTGNRIADIDIGAAGTYNTTYKKMRLYQEGNRVYGTYDHKDGRIEGRISGNVLKGMWYQSNGQGELEFTFSSDFKSFTSKYFDKGKWYTDWKGTKIN